MIQPPTEYKRSFFDRHGPGAAGLVTASVWGVAMGILTLVMLASVRGLTFMTILSSVGAGLFVGGLGPALGNAFGGFWNRVAVNGASTPSAPQFSRERSLVMQGKIEEAFVLLEKQVAADRTDVQVRILAAELYLSERHNPERSAQLLREAHLVRPMSVGDDVYIANRLVDLYVGPLNTPYKAFRELRRIIERYPNTSAGQHARVALAALKERYPEPLE